MNAQLIAGLVLLALAGAGAEKSTREGELPVLAITLAAIAAVLIARGW